MSMSNDGEKPEGALARELREILGLLVQGYSDLREQQKQLAEKIEELPAKAAEDDELTWPVSTIALKTGIPTKNIRAAMRSGELRSVACHRRGKGHVRVARPADVQAWINGRVKGKTAPVLPEKTPRGRKPPNVVF